MVGPPSQQGGPVSGRSAPAPMPHRRCWPHHHPPAPPSPPERETFGETRPSTPRTCPISKSTHC
eukprot:7376356-Prymnesium_polylepis.1